MKNDAAEILALRRKLLVLQSQLQRMNLRRDTRALAVQSNPLTLVARLAGRWTGGRGSSPAFTLIAVFAVAALRRWIGAKSR